MYTRASHTFFTVFRWVGEDFATAKLIFLFCNSKQMKEKCSVVIR